MLALPIATGKYIIIKILLSKIFVYSIWESTLQNVNLIVGKYYIIVNIILLT